MLISSIVTTCTDAWKEVVSMLFSAWGPNKRPIGDFVFFVKCHYKDFPRLLYKFWIISVPSYFLCITFTYWYSFAKFTSFRPSKSKTSLLLIIYLYFEDSFIIHARMRLENLRGLWIHKRIHVDCVYIKRVNELHRNTSVIAVFI